MNDDFVDMFEYCNYCNDVGTFLESNNMCDDCYQLFNLLLYRLFPMLLVLYILGNFLEI